MRPDIRIQGFPELRITLDGMRRDDMFAAVLEEAAYEVEARWKTKLTEMDAVDTGRYRGSVGVQKVGGLAYAVQSGVFYSPFIEMGTGRAGASSDQPGGVPPGYVHGPREGMRARPAARISLIEVRELLKEPSKWKDIV